MLNRSSINNKYILQQITCVVLTLSWGKTMSIFTRLILIMIIALHNRNSFSTIYCPHCFYAFEKPVPNCVL